jgi:hypothetical protein
MSNPKLRTLSNRKGIVKLLTRFLDEEINVLIFDSAKDLADENASYKKGVIFKVSMREGTFSVRSIDDDFSLFEKRKNLYLKIDDQGVAFSCFAENFGEKFGSFNLPSEVLLEEKRKYPRKALTGKMTMKVKANGFENSLRILDISCGGACLYIQEDLDIFLKNFRTFEVLSVSGVESFPMTAAKIVHSQLQPGTSVLKTLRVGVEFESALEEKLLEDFL